MTHISRFPLKEGVLEKLYGLFFKIVSNKDKNSFLEIMTDVLTPTERVMISKRVATIYLLRRGVSINEISRKLHLSTATVSYYVRLHFDRKSRIIEVVDSLIAKEETIGFLKDLAADMVILPGIKKGHWALYHENERQKAKRKTGGI